VKIEEYVDRVSKMFSWGCITTPALKDGFAGFDSVQVEKFSGWQRI
jgi:hypothetical protein